MKRLVIFVLSFVLWVLLTWPIDQVTGEVRVADIVLGLAVALVVALIMREFTVERFGRWLNPARYFWALIYIVVFTYYLLKANIDVAYRVLHPAMPIEPGIVRVKTRLKSLEARTVLANSITLTPGTLTVDIVGDFLYVHWINVRSKDDEEAAKLIIGRFEWFLERILD